MCWRIHYHLLGLDSQLQNFGTFYSSLSIQFTSLDDISALSYITSDLPGLDSQLQYFGTFYRIIQPNVFDTNVRFWGSVPSAGIS